MLKKTVIIFGVFDSIHDGHREFISQAKDKGGELVAIVARDKDVLELKGKLPKHNEVRRLEEVLSIDAVGSAFLGDEERGTYSLLKQIKPDIIFLGYDQTDLFNDIKKKIEEKVLPSVELIFGKPHNPETLHSSILNSFPISDIGKINGSTG